MKQFLNRTNLRRPLAWLLAAAMMGQSLPLFAVAEDADPNAGTVCGYVAHTHGDGCYTLQSKLTCTLPVGEGHTHDPSACFRQEQKLICLEEHDHVESCYETVNVQSCTQKEYEAHTHGDGCYTQEKVRTCTVTEHTHTESCYPVETPETCQYCGVELTEGAVHKDTCQTRCTCGQETHVSPCPLYVAPETCQHCGVELTEGVEHKETCLTRCTCGQETHVSPCPLYVAPETCEHCGVELTEGVEHKETCLTRCTCGQETHVSPCPLFVEPELSYYEKLMAAKTMEEFHELMMGDTTAFAAFTADELKALREQLKLTYAAMTEPSADETDYYNLLLETIANLLGEEELEGDPEILDDTVPAFSVTVGGKEYSHAQVSKTDAENYPRYVSALVEADLALLRWESMGSADNSAVSGKVDDVDYTGFAAVYGEVYKLLLSNATTTLDTGAAIVSQNTNYANETIEIIKLPAGENAEVTLDYKITLDNNERLIFVSPGATTIKVGLAGQIVEEDASANAAVAVQGSAAGKITIDGGNSKRNSGSSDKNVSAVFTLNGGSTFINNVIIQKFSFDDSEHTDAVFFAYNGFDRTRCLYMSGSTMKNITGGNSPGIYFRAYSDTQNEKNALSRIFLYNDIFDSITVYRKKSYSGGAVIRTFAADNTQLRAENCTFRNNKNDDNQIGSGGGAIYWKSAAGRADLIGCTFENNASASVGGAIYNTGEMTLTRCTFTGNKTTGTGGGGGAIAVEPPRTNSHFPNIRTNELSGSLTLDAQTTLSGNSTTGNGGAIYFNALKGDNGSRKNIYITQFEMSLEINGATISNNTAGGNGGGVAMYLNFESCNYATGVTITGNSKVQDNTAAGNGGAIWISSADNCKCLSKFENWNQGVTMNGGTLSENIAANGGGVYIHTGNSAINPMNFTMQGGSVTGNIAGTGSDASGNGGAAYIHNGNFVMQGGSLGASGAANQAKLGGGVYINSGSATVSSGNVQYNSAEENGGGIYINSGSVTVSGGSVNDNTAKKDGAGFYVNGGTATVSGGSVEANIADRNGGGMYVTGAADKTGVAVSGTGKISGNQAVDGGGVYLTGGSFTQEGTDTSIEGNTATGNGGGVYLTSITPELESGSITGNTARNNGGGIYIDKQDVSLTPNGTVSITGNTASGNGGGICISGTTANPAGFSIVDTSAGSITMTGNNAAYGGAVCIENGTFALENDKITVTGNEANNGGGVAVLSGTFTMTGGSLGASGSANRAIKDGEGNGGNGGGVYVSGGQALVSGGKVEGNTAFQGGGVYVTDGGVIMSGGEISHNTGSSNGGGVFVEAGTGQNAVVNIYSGSILSNTTNGGGGAVSVKGSETSNIDIQIGVNDIHGDPLHISHSDDYGIYTHTACPVIQDNQSGTDGGAVYISGGDETNFKIYCLTEDNNITGTGENQRSNFMKVEGGTVLISTSKTEGGVIDENTSGYGKIDINGSVYVTGGKVDIYGIMENPDFADRITVDINNAENDHYEDHRPVDDDIKKLRYFENFKNPDGSITGQYTDYMHPVNTEVTISGNIYSHPGYKIVGWYTEKDQATPNGTWYEVAAKHTLTEDLTIFAIWEIYGYTVKFYPNCDSYGGTEMEKQNFTIYPDGESQVLVALSTNTYTRPGYKFIGWDTKADGTGTAYENGESVVNLSTTDGAEVPLYAQWAACDHVNTAIFWSADGDTLIATCECGEKEWRARLSAEDAVYDGAEHGATLVYEKADAAKFSGLEITYEKDGESLTGTPVNAGTYTAKISKEGATAKIIYTIEKADQPAPVKPEYTPVITPETTVDGVTTPASSVLTIDKIDNSAETGAAAVYVLEYYDASSNLQRIEQYLNGDGKYIQKTYGAADTEPTETEITVQEGKGAVFILDYALTHYYVYAYYQETDNYKESARTSADQVYFHKGDVKIIIDGEGKITGEIMENDTADGLEIKLTDHEDYYRGREFAVTAVTKDSGNSNEHGTQATVTLNESGNAVLANIPDSCVITVTIRGMEKRAAITAAVEPGQKFSKITGTAASISRDSAFTASYTVTDFVPEKYKKDADSEPNISTALNFSRALPDGTTIILLENGKYWQASASGASLDLGEFTRMGGNGSYALDGDSTLQFIVDFSRCQAPPETGNLTMTLSIVDGENFVPTSETAVTVTLQNKSDFTLSSSGSGLTKTITYTYTRNAQNASIWEGRSSALVLTPPADLPADALLRVTAGEHTTVYRKNAEKKFIIPLAGLSSGNVTMTLESSGFPAAATTYTFGVEWYVSNSKAGSGPMNGAKEASAQVQFDKPEQKTPAAKLKGDKTLYSRSDDLQATLTGEALKTVEVRLYYKKYAENGSYQYEDTAYKKQIVWNDGTPVVEWTIDLEAFEQLGTYCLELTARDGVTILLDDVRYFFILQ